MAKDHGKHQSIPKELRPTITWLRSQPAVTKVICGRVENCRTRYPAGYLVARGDEPAGVKLRGYFGAGVMDFYAYTSERDRVRSLVAERFRKQAVQDEVANPVVRPEIVVFTDGACSPNPGVGGWAAVLRHAEDGRVRTVTGAERETTNNRMELRAAVEALAYLKVPCDVTVHTDSQYIAQAFNRHWLAKWRREGWRTAANKPVKNEDLWRQLLDLTARHNVTWSWVRGHNENEDNEQCDRLAVNARTELAARLKAG